MKPAVYPTGLVARSRHIAPFHDRHPQWPASQTVPIISICTAAEGQPRPPRLHGPIAIRLETRRSLQIAPQCGAMRQRPFLRCLACHLRLAGRTVADVPIFFRYYHFLCQDGFFKPAPPQTNSNVSRYHYRSRRNGLKESDWCSNFPFHQSREESCPGVLVPQQAVSPPAAVRR